jgi:hypothetical protein
MMSSVQKLNSAYGIDTPLQAIPPKPISAKRDPTINDKMQFGTLWINTVTDLAFVLTSITGNAANWQEIAQANPLPTLLDGQLIIGSTGNPPVATNLTPGTGIAISNGAGSVTISATGGGSGFTWNQVNIPYQSPITMLGNNGYWIYSYALPETVVFNLDASYAPGDTIQIAQGDSLGMMGAVGWQINLSGSGQTILYQGVMASTSVAPTTVSSGTVGSITMVLSNSLIPNERFWIITNSSSPITLI